MTKCAKCDNEATRNIEVGDEGFIPLCEELLCLITAEIELNKNAQVLVKEEVVSDEQ